MCQGAHAPNQAAIEAAMIQRAKSLGESHPNLNHLDRYQRQLAIDKWAAQCGQVIVMEFNELNTDADFTPLSSAAATAMGIRRTYGCESSSSDEPPPGSHANDDSATSDYTYPKPKQELRGSVPDPLVPPWRSPLKNPQKPQRRDVKKRPALKNPQQGL